MSNTTLLKFDPGPTEVDPSTDEIRVKGVVLGTNGIAKITEVGDELFFEDTNNGTPISLQSIASGGGSSTPSFTEVTISQDLNLSSTSYMYFGDSATDGSFRLALSGGALVVEQRQTGVWVTISSFSPAG